MDIIIFGASSGGKQLYEFIQNSNTHYNVKYFLDNNKVLDKFCELDVYRLEEVEIKKNEIIVIASSYYKEISQQLVDSGKKPYKDFINYKDFELAVKYFEMAQANIKENQIVYDTRKTSLEELMNKKKTNKLFILGSGTTINDFTQEHWDEIALYDSWGVNYWPLHDFKPTFYSTEFAENKEGFHNLLRIIAEKKIKVDFIKGLFFMTSKDIAELQRLEIDYKLLNSIPLLSKDEDSYNRNYEYLKKLRILNEQCLPSYRSSVVTVLYLALQMGYDEIIFCGVELKNKGYFYDNFPNHDNYTIPRYNEQWYSNLPEHLTNIKHDGNLSAFEEIQLFAKMFSGCKIYTATRNSVLYPRFEQYSFKGLVRNE